MAERFEAESEGVHAILQRLMTLGFVETVDDDARVTDGAPVWYRLTAAGHSAIRPLTGVSPPRPFFIVREHLPLENRSQWELIKALDIAGWTVHRNNLPVKERRQLEHRLGVPDAPLVGYFSGLRHLYSEYMLCLLRGRELFDRHGIVRIPHHVSKVSVYQKLLKGQVVADSPSLPALPAPEGGHAAAGE